MATKGTKKRTKKQEPESKSVQAEVNPIEESAAIDLASFGIENYPELSITDMATLREYFSNGMNGTKAWQATHPNSGYDTASVKFYEWVRTGKISPIMEKIRENIAMDVFEAVSRMGAIARGDIRHFLMQGADGFMYLDLSNPEAQAHMYLVEQVETKRERRIQGFGETAEEFEGEWVKVKLHSAPAALRDILKMHGKFVQKMEVTGKGGEPLIPPVDQDGYKESIIALADALGEILSRKSSEENGEMGSPK